MADPGYLSNAELAAKIVALVQKYNLFTGEQMAFFTTPNATTVITNPDGDPVTVPSLAALVGDFAATAALKAELEAALDEFKTQGLSYDLTVYDKAPAGELAMVFPVAPMAAPPSAADWKFQVSNPSSTLVITLYKITPQAKAAVATLQHTGGVLGWSLTPHSLSVNDAVSIEITAGTCSKVAMTVRYSLIDWATNNAP